MHKVTYKITDSNGKVFEGQFLTYRKTAEVISLKIVSKHPEILLPFKSHNVKVNKA